MADTGDITERMFRALCVQLMRAGKLDRADVEAAVSELEAKGDDEAAHNLQCFTLHADAPSMTEWHAERQARRMIEQAQHRAKKSDGGKAGG